MIVELAPNIMLLLLQIIKARVLLMCGYFCPQTVAHHNNFVDLFCVDQVDRHRLKSIQL